MDMTTAKCQSQYMKLTFSPHVEYLFHSMCIPHNVINSRHSLHQEWFYNDINLTPVNALCGTLGLHYYCKNGNVIPI